MADFANDLEILNYALTLEHLEAQMYRQIVSSGQLTGVEQQYATDFGAHEAAHVTALTATIRMLGGTPVAAQASYRFPAFDTRDNIVRFLVTVEDLGAAAYLAAAPEVQNLDVLQAAVAIHNIEGEHASIWRRAAGMAPVPVAFAVPARRADVLAAVTPFLMGGGAAAGSAVAATGTGGGVATATRAPGSTVAVSTATRPAGAVATGTGGGAATATRPMMALPQTGVARPQGDGNGAAAAVAAGIAAVGVGFLLRARSYKRSAKTN